MAAGADAYVSKAAGAEELQTAVVDVARHRPREQGDPLRLLGRITAGVAHDLSNYLTVVDVALRLLQRRPDDRELWLRARAAIDSAGELTQNLVSYARGGAPATREVDLVALVRRTLAMIAGTMSPGVVAVIDAADTVPPVRGVAAELEQLVLNLVLNACDAMPGGGELRIVVRSPGPSAVVLEVSDSGQGGIEGFFAAGATSPSSKRSGNGLGLGIVRGVVDVHHGLLDVAPRAGGGTRVKVTLPTWTGAAAATR